MLRHWRDGEGREHTVADEVLAAVLQALGHRTGSSRSITASLAELDERGRGHPAMVVTEVGLPTPLATEASHAEVTGEDGATRQIAFADGHLEAISEPGYYQLSLGRQTMTLAVAPKHCPLPGQRMWGTSIQIPALRSERSRAFGGFGELVEAVDTLGRHGCDALAINPVHALLPGHGEHYSPYSASSRTYLNPAMGDPALHGLPALDETAGGQLIDWASALPQRLDNLRRIFAGLDFGMRAEIARANAAEGEGLRRHALFDALHCRFGTGWAAGWRGWPARFQRPGAAAVQRFARENAEEIEFHLFAQWLARSGLAEAQRSVKLAGMEIGLITDLAVGVHPGGSDSWAMPEAMLHGLTIGAPPDPLGPLGQNWSITGFSPQGLRDCGYRPFIAMLRSAMRSAGGLRIDHAFGLARLWVIPEGGNSGDGAYLEYPFLDLMRLVTLEAHRASALIIAEDLGTAPFGFTEAVTDRHMLGMRVLWFERATDNGFIGAQDYPENCVAMTGTHDTPTVAGWWTGRDLDWAAGLGRLPEGVDRDSAERIRAWDRGLLWSTIGEGERPGPDDPDPVVEAALAHVAGSSAVLAIAPLEDLLGEVEQPNLPGTTTEHPNWRRRLAAPLDALLGEAPAVKRVSAISNRS